MCGVEGWLVLGTLDIKEAVGENRRRCEENGMFGELQTAPYVGPLNFTQ